MKAGLTTSVILHAALIGFGLLTLTAPSALEVADVQALPVDIIPIESLTQIQQGDKKSPVNEKPAPLPTEKPDIVADARKVGENTVDTDKPATPEAKPIPVDTAAAPPPSPKPVEKPDPKADEKTEPDPAPVPATEVAPVPQPKEEVKPEPVKEPEPVKQPEPKPEPTPAQETTAAVEPRQEVKPDSVTEAIAADPAPPTEAVQLPNSAPAPQAKPSPPQARTAQTPERKDSDKPAKEAASKPKSSEKEFNADEVAALLNKQKPSGGGAKRSTQQASLGGDKTTGEKLSQGEMDALSNQLSGCWSIPAGLADGAGLRVSVRFNLDGAGKLEGRPTVDASSGNQQFDESAVRAVQKCDRDGLQLPKDKAETWAEVVVNFDPSEMF